MVKYLLEHRIAVFMTFLALVIVGCITYSSLSVSLLPDIDIPHITVKINRDNTSARELENTVVTPLRRQLMQVTGLDEIKSETRDGQAVIYLTLGYGIDTDVAYIEANEKIDAAMNSMPRDLTRPKAVKASATDLPVLYVQMTADDDSDEKFLDMADVARNIVRRRLEQLPEIAMVDITGLPDKILQVVPDNNLMAQAGVTLQEIENMLINGNIEPGSMTVRDGYYEYNIRVTNTLTSVDDVKGLRIVKGDRVFSLGDFADVKISSRTPAGYSIHNGKRAITLAIIKHSEADMDDMREALDNTINYFSASYPDVHFDQTRDQTELLRFTISNLQQNLLLGLILVFLVCIAFMGSFKSSCVIGLNIVVSVIITFLTFYFFHVSINIISMSGLILAVGMMIDNAVIVTENITQMRQRGMTVAEACVAGTNEMITPMLSSSLTTVAVFVPLVFMSGIAGAIFSDQAFAITAGLAVSYIVGITLLPVLYYIMYRNAGPVVPDKSGNILHGGALDMYDRGIDFCFKYRWPLIVATLATIPLCGWLFGVIERERMPYVDSREMIMNIDWNDNINVEENLRRTMSMTDSAAVSASAFVATQDFLLNVDHDYTAAESELYMVAETPADVAPIQERLAARINSLYPGATATFGRPTNIFEKIFATDEADIEARFSRRTHATGSDVKNFMELCEDVTRATGHEPQLPPVQDQLNIIVDRDKAALYKVDFAEIDRALKAALKGNVVSTLRSYDEYTPVEVAGRRLSVNELLSQTLVPTRPDNKGKVSHIPLSSLVTTTRSTDFKTISSGIDGEYLQLDFDALGDEERVMTTVRETVNHNKDYDVSFKGSFFSNTKLMGELAVILLVSLLLMYFILCAQFESFLQPLIVLLEIPVDVAFAILTLMIFGHTLNLMSAIGIIVTCGIVVNDSILKIDSINELRNAGMPLTEAIHTAGRRRLRAIIMTSLTTILAMIPMLFTSDMGSELQRPLAIAMIGSMVVGTIISIFVIPLFYWLIYRKQAARDDARHGETN